MNPNAAQPVSLISMGKSLLEHHELIYQMIQREVVGRYKGSVMGLLWSFITPVLMLIVYTFVFTVVFKAKWGVGGDESKSSFAILLFVGMIVHALFAECVNRAPGIVISNVNYVKKVIFPLEILPWVTMGVTLFHTMTSLIVLLLAQLLVNQTLPWTAILFPVIILPLVLVTMGFVWALSATGVFIRDIGHTIGIFTTALLFLSPVFG